MAIQIPGKGKRVICPARTKLGKELGEKYEKGASVRALAEEIGRSYGFVYGLLTEAGVSLRSRGGDRQAVAARYSKRRRGPQ
ncbi:helix-turn-helix domain-containing protein [Lentzea sp. NPDC059081]|uniref:helix-turn-helix domain-containing protein n=1 Tax=Lentzea sp. NPDC059081 TaxID=3346719 RepID=UPI0036A4B088